MYENEEVDEIWDDKCWEWKKEWHEKVHKKVTIGG